MPLAPENMNQYRYNDADDDRGSDGDKDSAAFSLDADIPWQFAEPVQQPGGELEYQPDNQKYQAGDDYPASHRILPNILTMFFISTQALQRSI